MALIHFRFEAEGPGGVRVPGKVWFRFTPTARRVITGTPDTVVLDESFTRELVAGALDEILAPNDPAVWLWEIEEHVGRALVRTLYVTVPDVAELDYPDLVAVDPATLAPTAAPVAAWWAMASATVTAGTVVGDELVLTRTDGTTVTAGNVRGLPGADGADSIVPGPDGADSTVPGPAGESAYQVAVGNGFVGDEAAWLASLEGADGDPGSAGPANTLTVGTVSTVAAGGAATASVTGASPNQTLNLGLPAGAKGDTGNPSAFELRGSGMPNGTVTATPGTYYTDTAGTNGAWRWIKKTGTGNTGWVVISGDTGWRTIPNPPGFTANGFIQIRRVGNSVTFRLSDVWIQSGGLVTNISPVIAGFGLTGFIVGQVYAGGVLKGVIEAKSGGFWTNLTATATWATSYIVGVTDDAWPTTLPGTAA